MFIILTHDIDFVHISYIFYTISSFFQLYSHLIFCTILEVIIICIYGFGWVNNKLGNNEPKPTDTLTAYGS